MPVTGHHDAEPGRRWRESCVLELGHAGNHRGPHHTAGLTVVSPSSYVKELMTANGV
jgi:hypothetical protein